ncbi:hypothetical protein BC835DRAFT_592545 [Cytidiella melzeri]|nr:hypothetical protein BC835DRAFT_592545 [Cytidiella melzeri]
MGTASLERNASPSAERGALDLIVTVAVFMAYKAPRSSTSTHYFARLPTTAVRHAMKTISICDLLESQEIIKDVQVVGFTLLVFDWLLSIGDESTLVWESPNSFIKCLYLWTRYSPIADASLSFLSHFGHPISPQECRVVNGVNTFLLSAGIYTSELVLLWRTFAIWKGSNRVKYGLGSLWLLMIPFDFYFLASYVSSAVYAPQPLPWVVGCNLVNGSSIILGTFVSLTILELIIVTLTIWKGIQDVRVMRHTRLITVLYRDGVLFFICLLVLSVSCILAPLLGPPIYALLLPSLLRVMHSTLCCRVILHIRQAAAAQTSTTPTLDTVGRVQFGTIRFASPAQASAPVV